MNRTYLCLLISLIIGSILTLPSINYWGDFNWRVAQSFPLSVLGMGMHQMDIFFHEIGHTIFHWFYGMPSIPTFDFDHGGGVAHAWPQNTFLIITIHAAFIGGLLYFKDNRPLQILIAAIGLFDLATVYNESHEAIYLFMGHGVTIAMGSFLLYRAWFDLAPRGVLERYLNGIIGFGIIFQNMVLFVGLMKDDIVRTVYYQQKDGHGKGDFDRIVSLIEPATVQNIALVSFLYALVFLILPAIAYFLSNKRLIDAYGDIDETLQKNM